MKNKIARLVEIKKIKIFEEEIPELKKGEILVEIKAVGICGSDIHYFLEGGLGSFKQDLPMDIGHEPAGVVNQVFDKESKFRKGDRVAIEPGRPCLNCRWCLKGKHNLCEKGIFMVANSQGAFAKYAIVSEVQLSRIPNEMSFETASLMEPLGVALHAVNLTQANPLGSATIIGSGPIGLSILLTLKKFGFTKIYMVDKLPYRVKYAKKIGATESFSFDEAKEGIKKVTGNIGTEYVFDTGGSSESVNLGIEVISISGTLALVGIPTGDFIQINPHKSRTKEITIKNVRRSNQTLDDCIRLFAKDKDVEKLITHKFMLEDIQKGFDIVSKYNDNVIKCIIVNN